MSVGIHLVSPASKGLFRRAIMESNPLGLNYNSKERMMIYAETACDDMGCLPAPGAACNMTCARAAPVSTVLNAVGKSGGSVWDYILANWGRLLDGFLPWKPCYGDDVLEQDVIPALEAGSMHEGVDVLVGTNTDEAETFLMGGSKTMAVWEAEAAVELVFGKDSARLVLDYYSPPRYNFTDGRLLLSRVLTHYWFRCASEKFANAAAAGNGTSAYVYRYDHVFSVGQLFSAFGLPKFCANHTCHASELPFVFRFDHITTPKLNATMTPGEVTLSDDMVQFWTNFARSGDPNAGGAAHAWPKWSADTRQNIVLDEQYATEDSVDLCANLWDKVGYNH